MLSAAARSHRLATRRRARGFTLLELLVVVAIVALASAVVVLALPDSDQTRLEREATRLAYLLEGARAQSRASGQPVYWRPGGDNGSGSDFRFDGLSARADIPTRWLEADGAGGPALQAEIVPPRAGLVLGPEPVIDAQAVRLRLGQRQLTIATDGLGPFAVQLATP